MGSFIRSVSGINHQLSRFLYAFPRRSSSTSAAFKDGPQLSHEAKPYGQMPGPKGLYNIPYLGAMFLFKPFSKYTPLEVADLIEEKWKIYGDIFRMRFGTDYIVYVNHPDDARTVLQANYELHKRAVFDLNIVTAERLNITKGIVILEGEEWALRRKPAQEKMLRPAVVASYVPLIEKVTNDMIENIRNQPTTDDLLFDLYNYTTESVGMLCFNKRLGCLESKQNNPPAIAICMGNLLEMMQKTLLMPVKLYMHFRTPFYKLFEKEAMYFYETVEKEIKTQREFLQNVEKEGKLEEYLEREPNFMYSLLSDGRLTDEQVGSIVGDLFGAGIDSSANTLVFMLTNLCLNPDKQNKLYKEIQRVVGGSKTLTKEHIAQMSYLKACLRESHRITFPSSFGTVRVPESEMVVGGYIIPKDTLVAINNRLMCMDERFFPRPKEFIPERWLRETTGELAKSKKYPFAHKPFGFGPRSCIGQRFAENEIFIAIAKIIQNFEVSMPPEVKKIKTTLRIFTTPVDKVKMTFTDRKTS